MILALRVFGASLRQVATHLTASLLSNVCAVLLSLPVLMLLSAAAHGVSLSVLPLGVVLLLGVLPSPAMAGLQLTAHALSAGETLTIREQWNGVRHYWRGLLTPWLLGVVVSAIMVINVVFYPELGRSHSPLHLLAGPAEFAWASALMFWLAMHLYIYPLWLRQEWSSIVLVYRNAAVMVLARPLATLVLTVVWLAWLLLAATTGPAYVFGLVLAASIQQNALARILPGFGIGSSLVE